MAKQVCRLRPDEAAYLAGLIDGEGSITLSRRYRSGQRQLAVSISNTEKELLNSVMQMIGAGKLTNKRRDSKLHQQSYTYQISNRQALELLRQTAPFLRGYKRKRAELVLTFYLEVTPRNGRYSEELLLKKRKFEQAFLAITAHGRPARQRAGENGAHIGEP